MNLKKNSLHWFPVIFYLFLIFYLSSRSDVGVSHDKLAHIAAYSVMCVLFVWALCLHLKSLFPLIFCAIILTTLYGMSDEYHQSFVPGRDSSIYDVYADFAGALIGALFYVLITRFSKYKSAN